MDVSMVITGFAVCWISYMIGAGVRLVVRHATGGN